MNINTGFFAVVCLVFSAVSFADDGDIVEIRFLSGEKTAEDVAKFWTPERIKAAKAYPMPEVEVEGEPEEPEGMESEESAEATESALKPGKPKKVKNYEHHPYSPGGKLFFFVGLTSSGYCSAQYDYDNNVILTAAHCLLETDGTFHTDMYFLRAYNNDGVGPTWSQWVPIEKGYHFKGYITGHKYKLEKNTPFDVAVLCGEKSEVSQLGLYTNDAGVIGRNPVAIGYPSNYDDGNAMYQVQAEDTYMHYQVPGTLYGVLAVKKNPFGHGSSGGAWLLTTSDGIQGTVMGINAAKRKHHHDKVFSPWFTSEVLRLFDYGKDKCN